MSAADRTRSRRNPVCATCAARLSHNSGGAFPASRVGRGASGSGAPRPTAAIADSTAAEAPALGAGTPPGSITTGLARGPELAQLGTQAAGSEVSSDRQRGSVVAAAMLPAPRASVATHPAGAITKRALIPTTARSGFTRVPGRRAKWSSQLVQRPRVSRNLEMSHPNAKVKGLGGRPSPGGEAHMAPSQPCRGYGHCMQAKQATTQRVNPAVIG